MTGHLLSKRINSIEDVKLVKFPLFDTRESFLVVYEGGKTVPFLINRIFVVKSIEKSIRGFHAHKQCSQLLVVLNGECTVTLDDGNERKNIILNKSSEGLLILPTIWAEQEYQPNTVLMVLTDHPYDETDYIRNYEEFLDFRKNS
jgi:dTDP-4-dehydrorhamnose 3,5-epimerase-like enzyme